MNLETLCNGINLPQEIQGEVLKFYRSDAFSQTQNILGGLRNMATESSAREALKLILGEDEAHLKMLTCMLACAAEQHTWYQEKGIPDSVFWDTMGCFTRFIRECRASTGGYAFDREWWTARQLSGILFRIGELEYEMADLAEGAFIRMHIPSDSVLTKELCDKSIADAKAFFAKYFPAYSTADYTCESWLLAPELAILLPERSHILAFQKRFHLESVTYTETEYFEWVFQTKSTSIADFPENTTLQKNMKHYLQNGGKIGCGYGILTQ